MKKGLRKEDWLYESDIIDLVNKFKNVDMDKFYEALLLVEKKRGRLTERLLYNRAGVNQVIECSFMKGQLN